MVKEPRAGRVKTRLGRDMGMTGAAWWYRHQTGATLRTLSDPRWDLLLAVSPDTACGSGGWPPYLHRVPQGKGDLGLRMQRALRQTQGPSLLIGSDIPGITRGHIVKAFASLGTARSVIGPATDGGFWLVGLQHPQNAPKSLFENVRWSHPATLQDTLPTLPAPVAIAATLNDVDTIADLQHPMRVSPL